MSEAFRPVIAYASCHGSHEKRGQVGDTPLLGQHQKPRVIRYKVEVFELAVPVPPYPSVSGGAHEGGCMPSGDSEPGSFMLGYVTNVVAYKFFEAEIVMFVHEPVPLGEFIGTGWSYNDVPQAELGGNELFR